MIGSNHTHRPSYRWSRRLSAEPLHAFVARVGTAQAAREWRVSERRVRAIKRQRTVQLATADELAIRSGEHLSAWWPEA